jgi:hypothetical protein
MSGAFVFQKSVVSIVCAFFMLHVPALTLATCSQTVFKHLFLVSDLYYFTVRPSSCVYICLIFFVLSSIYSRFKCRHAFVVGWCML